MAKLLRPGGVLRLRDLIFDCQPAEAEAVLDDWLDGAVTDPERGYTREDFAEHLRTEFSTFQWLLEPMLAAGFRIVAASFEGRSTAPTPASMPDSARVPGAGQDAVSLVRWRPPGPP